MSVAEFAVGDLVWVAYPETWMGKVVATITRVHLPGTKPLKMHCYYYDLDIVAGTIPGYGAGKDIGRVAEEMKKFVGTKNQARAIVSILNLAP